MIGWLPPSFELEHLDTCVRWLDQSSRTCSDITDQPNMTWSQAQMNRRKSLGGTDAAEHRHFYKTKPRLIFILSLLKMKELNKRVKCPVSRSAQGYCLHH